MIWFIGGTVILTEKKSLPKEASLSEKKEEFSD